ncbi:hypothetical protein KIPB_005942 [Kipferlia bialata]|uniref:Uncharacterized protein n=1 Tax=Kipferlia bialata TaxID=797122 RepID=A0A9K3GJD3_9EUKA|nr:hypothetical protein KIPB_005942 [Kipferlia bialata]|eukprot:g5942.t1
MSTSASLNGDSDPIVKKELALKQPKRLLAVDIARGIAMLGLVMNHEDILTCSLGPLTLEQAILRLQIMPTIHYTVRPVGPDSIPVTRLVGSHYFSLTGDDTLLGKYQEVVESVGDLCIDDWYPEIWGISASCTSLDTLEPGHFTRVRSAGDWTIAAVKELAPELLQCHNVGMTVPKSLLVYVEKREPSRGSGGAQGLAEIQPEYQRQIEELQADNARLTRQVSAPREKRAAEVVWQQHPLATAYARELLEVFGHPENYYLVDCGRESMGSPKVGQGQAHTIVVAPPNKGHYGALTKDGGASVLTMSMWSLRELIGAAPYMLVPQPVPTRVQHREREAEVAEGGSSESSRLVRLPDSVITQRFKQMGGRPRFIFCDEERYDDLRGETHGAIRAMGSALLEDVLRRRAPPINMGGKPKDGAPSSEVVGYLSEYPFGTSNRTAVFVSQCVMEELAYTYARDMWECLDKVPEQFASFKEKVFEKRVCQQLAAGGKFDRVGLPNRTAMPPLALGVPESEEGTREGGGKMRVESKVVEVESLVEHIGKQDDDIYWSPNPSEAGIDASFRHGILQMTRNKVSQPMSRSGIWTLIKRTGADREGANPLVIYFAIPKGNWERKTDAVPFEGKEPKGWPGDKEVQRMLRQVILYIPPPTVEQRLRMFARKW